MSEEELVGAYVAGSVSRRVFIRGLVAIGVSAGAAVAYADALSAQTPSRASQVADVYDVYPVDTGAAATGGVGATQIGQGGSDPSVQARPRFTG